MQHQRKTVAVILRSCAREKSYARSPHRVSVIRFRRSIFSVFSTHTESAQKKKSPPPFVVIFVFGLKHSICVNCRGYPQRVVVVIGNYAGATRERSLSSTRTSASSKDADKHTRLQYCVCRPQERIR